MDFATPGTVIADRYRLTRPLGTGSSAVVWEALDTSLGRMVAVKLLHGGAADHPAGREQLRREAQALARLAHPRITTVFDYVEVPALFGAGDAPDPGHGLAQIPAQSQPVLVTELLNGQLLEERLAAGPLTEADARRACAQLAEALGAAHEAGIVHRDLKPGNVMLVGEGVKLLDFGIAQSASDTDTTTDGGTGRLAVGTPACMAPEQLTGQGAVPASDVYALGCVLYWCLTGHAPYSGATVDQVVAGHLRGVPPQLVIPGLPPQVAGLFRQCLAKDPTQRPSAGTVAAVLQQQAVPTPRVNQTMVMPAYEAPPPPSFAGTQLIAPMPGRHPGQLPPPDHWQPYDAPYPQYEPSRTRPAAEPEGRRPSRGILVLGAVAVAGLAAGATALLMNGSGGGQGAAGSGTSTSQSPSTPAASSASSGSTGPSSPNTATGTPPGAGAPTDPNGDPLAYLEQVKAQIQGYIADGTISDASAGQNIQTSIGDLENSIMAAQQNGFTSKKLRDVKAKSDRLKQRIDAAAEDGKFDKDAAAQVDTEIQQLYDALSSKNG